MGYIAMIQLSYPKTTTATVTQQENIYFCVQECLQIHHNAISSLSIKGNFLYVTSLDKTFSVIRMQEESTDSPYEIIKPMCQTITDAATHADMILSIAPVGYSGSSLFTSSWDTSIRYWQQVEVKVFASLQDKQKFQSKQQQGVDINYDVEKKWTSYQFPAEHLKKVGCLAYYEATLSSFHGYSHSLAHGVPSDSKGEKKVKILISGSLDTTAIVWDVANPKYPNVIRHLIGHKDEIISVKILSDHLPIAFTASKDSTVRSWDLLTGKCFREFAHPAVPYSIDLLRLVTDDNLDHMDGQDDDQYKKETLLGDMIASACDDAVLMWNLLSNHRQCSMYTDSVTSLAAYACTSSSIGSQSPPNNNNNKKVFTLIGTSKSTVNISLHGEPVTKLHIGNPTEAVRVNVITIFSWEQNDYVICGLSGGFLSISTLEPTKLGFQELAYFHSKLQHIFALDCYKPSVSNKIDTDPPLLFCGGVADHKGHVLHIWKLHDLIQYLSTAVKLNENGSKEVSMTNEMRTSLQIEFGKMSEHTCRCISVHPYCTLNMFLTGDYTASVTVWNLHTRQPIMKLKDLHKQTIVNVQMFDPQEFAESTNHELDVKWSLPAGTDEGNSSEIDLRDCVLICTSGYGDGRIGLWPINIKHFEEHMKKPEVASKLTFGAKDAFTLDHEDGQSVTAMTLFFPKGGSKHSKPLLISGSIDNLIYVWDLYDRTLLRILTGHHNRVNALLTYFLDSQTPLLVSGSDDCSTVFWFDGLQHSNYPPSKDLILRTFYSDIFTPGHNWEQMRILAKQYPDQQIFYEFPQLFFLALMERQESFFLEFAEDLKYVIHRIPLYFRSNRHNACRWRFYKPTSDVDLLEYAMHTNSSIALRAILRAWGHVLGQSVDDALRQQVLHVNRCFNERNLLELSLNFPVEYVSFISSLKLVRTHKSVESVNYKMNRVISNQDRQIIIGSNDFKFGPLDSKFRPPLNQQSRFFRVRKAMRLTIDFLTSLPKKDGVFSSNHDLQKQAVMPFMLPIQKFADVRQLKCLVTISETLDKVELFDSEVVITTITHYWNRFGFKVYCLNLIKYSLTVIIFCYAIYTAQHAMTEQAAAINQQQPSTGVVSGSISNLLANEFQKARNTSKLFILLMAWYALDEICQIFGYLWTFHKNTWTISMLFHVFVSHVIFDFWNAIDCAVIVTGIVGMVLEIRDLNRCQYSDLCQVFAGHITDHQSVLGSCLLATTAVLLWFKVLYFLRPIQAAGRFGKRPNLSLGSIISSYFFVSFFQ
jgi:WD40 repeat protein